MRNRSSRSVSVPEKRAGAPLTARRCREQPSARGWRVQHDGGRLLQVPVALLLLLLLVPPYTVQPSERCEIDDRLIRRSRSTRSPPGSRRPSAALASAENRSSTIHVNCFPGIRLRAKKRANSKCSRLDIHKLLTDSSNHATTCGYYGY